MGWASGMLPGGDKFRLLFGNDRIPGSCAARKFSVAPTNGVAVHGLKPARAHVEEAAMLCGF